jgi:DNA primase small subunit
MDVAQEFDPLTVPTLGQLMKELDDYDGDSVGYEWQKTSLKGAFEHFQKKFLHPMLNDVRKSQRAEREKRAAVVGDF